MAIVREVELTWQTAKSTDAIELYAGSIIVGEIWPRNRGLWCWCLDADESAGGTCPTEAEAREALEAEVVKALGGKNG